MVVSENFKLLGKVAMVFGGSRGIGTAIVRRLAEEGADVVLTYASAENRAAETVEAVEAMGRKALAIKADSADAGAIQNAVAQAVDRFGRLDIIVVNAGVLRLGSVETFGLEELDHMLDVNVRGVFVAIQAAAPRLTDGGRVITIGSNTAIRTGFPGSSVYSMTKAAVATMVKGIALDLAPRAITVNNVQPGPTETDMTADHLEKVKSLVPLGRVGQPHEIAGLVAYLASDESAYMTGASLTIDGGYVL
ncbi:3-oxoacyl-ACP reductase family protein [Phyllobacterium sp. P30BS-XVII]|uniref:3-oxoacyl-ACP reductase family protein n=1 Tax=Phyllobacterium sp. P30BS-XVII TaxID=2587046 RepID=UPI001AEE5B7F|nr:3-oxoacyl-ACP reductase family protein [Phyllobacterium sp. P30BS-XVII]